MCDTVIDGRYELEERIGAGGMAEVWRASRAMADGSTQRVALKRILPRHADNPEALDRLDREAKLCEDLCHANVIKVLDYIKAENGERWIVMEYIDGLTLAELCSATIVEYGPLRWILLQALIGLQYMHMNGVIHRDISLGNIMVTSRGEVKLMDLGLARCVDRPLLDESQGPVLGTVAYASHEVFTGEKLDESSDLYSLAAVFFHIILNRHPFGSGGAAEVRWNQERDERCEIPDRVPEDFRFMFESLLVKREERQFRDPQDLLNELFDVWGSSCPGASEFRELAFEVERIMAAKPPGSDNPVHDSSTLLLDRQPWPPCPPSAASNQSNQSNQSRAGVWPVKLAVAVLLSCLLSAAMLWYEGSGSGEGVTNLHFYVDGEESGQ